MIIRESSTYRHAMEVTIVRAEAIAIEETPDKLTIILDKETMRQIGRASCRERV